MMPDVWLRGGLIDPKHVERMGKAVWLYLHLHTVVRFSGEGAGATLPDQPYQHDAAAQALGQPRRNVERWFAQLVEGGYITVTRRRLGYDVSITKYEDLRERAARHAKNGASNKEGRDATTGVPQPRPAESGASRHAKNGAEIRQICRDDAPEVAGLVYKDARASNGSKESNEGIPPISPVAPKTQPAPKPLTRIQECVNAYLEAVGRDPTVVKNYGRYAKALQELETTGVSAVNVRHCVAYLLTNPFFADHPPAPEQVVAAYPIWVRNGRQARWRPPKRGAPDGISALADEIERLTRPQNGATSDYPSDIPQFEPNGALDAGGLPERPRQVAGELPYRRLS